VNKLFRTIQRTIRRVVRRDEREERLAEAVPTLPVGAPPPRPRPAPDVAHTGRIIGVLNYKGGTGKTTTVVSMAAGLALRGARVLCIDLDAQGGLATYFDAQYEFCLTHLLLDQMEAEACIVPARENLDLIASDRSIVDVERQLWRMSEEARYRLAERMQGISGYDYIFLDYSPSISLVGECGLLYNHEVIVPTAMDYMALVGTRQVVDTLKTIKQTYAHDIRLSLVVPTFYDERQRLDREVLDLLKKHFGSRVADPIRVNVKLSEAPSHGMLIYEYAPNSAGAADYARLVERIVGRE
jgi:chromosome partitioning protein